MGLRFFLIVLFSFLYSTTFAREWKQEEKILFTMYSIENLIDGLQTIDIYRHKEINELNPLADWIYGQSGDVGIISYIILNTGIVYLLVDKMAISRKYFLLGMNTFKIGVIINNHSVGCRIKLNF